MEDENKEEETKKITKKEFKVVEVPTQTGRVIETPDGKLMEQDEAIVKILNLLEKISRQVG